MLTAAAVVWLLVVASVDGWKLVQDEFGSRYEVDLKREKIFDRRQLLDTLPWNDTIMLDFEEVALGVGLGYVSFCCY